jgi:hypothetical protein
MCPLGHGCFKQGKTAKKCFYQMPKLINIGEEPLLMEK